MIVILMGVAGAGKSTVGSLLAGRLNWAFHDGDGLHPDANIRKMASGTPLTDDDRWPWLARIAAVMQECEATGRNAVIACSALRSAYREYLFEHGGRAVVVYLRCEREMIAQRLRQRSDHFMPADLLDSQFDALEEPREAFAVDAADSPGAIVGKIVEEIARIGAQEGQRGQKGQV